MRDREGLFNEYILEVRRREKDEKIQKKETVSVICKEIYGFSCCWQRMVHHVPEISNVQ